MSLNLLLRSANWVGDAIMTTPAVRAIRKGVPDARITLLAKPWVAPVFDHNPHIDEIMLYNADGEHRGLKGMIHLSAQLRKRKFDVALLFQNAFEAALITWLARIPRRIGYTTDGRGILLTEKLRHWRLLKKGHLVDYYLGLLPGLGRITTDGRHLDLENSADEKQRALSLLSSQGVAPSETLIGLNPGATYGTAKRWPLERFAKLGKHLSERFGAKFLIFGSKQEAELGAVLSQALGSDAFNLAGLTTLREAFALIELCRLFITNDSGLMHAAAALDVSQIALIGPTDPMATAPIGSRSILVQNRESCPKSPCLLTQCPTDHRCMTAISVEQVFKQATMLLEKNK
jgi:heptosyltransferase-2